MLQILQNIQPAAIDVIALEPRDGQTRYMDQEHPGPSIGALWTLDHNTRVLIVGFSRPSNN